ncbi:MAG: hypothetical protein JW954_05510 [Dehalococcoidaceae bacterium]|nr:hypothetical protein [Dehalococcoidaceae bacterium]
MQIKEFRDLAISALALALAFGIALSGGLRAFQQPGSLLQVAGMAFLAVSTSFILHELAHRLIARNSGYFAEYAMWPAGLAIALGSSLLGFIFAAPGAVVIRHNPGTVTTPEQHRRNIGMISIAGPVTNIILAMVFLILNNVYPILLFYLGAFINTWLAIFNLLPFGPLDGAKIFWWSKTAWGAAIAIAGLLYLAQGYLF